MDLRLQTTSATPLIAERPRQPALVICGINAAVSARQALAECSGLVVRVRRLGTGCTESDVVAESALQIAELTQLPFDARLAPQTWSDLLGLLRTHRERLTGLTLVFQGAIMPFLLKNKGVEKWRRSTGVADLQVVIVTNHDLTVLGAYGQEEEEEEEELHSVGSAFQSITHFRARGRTRAELSRLLSALARQHPSRQLTKELADALVNIFLPLSESTGLSEGALIQGFRSILATLTFDSAVDEDARGRVERILSKMDATCQEWLLRTERARIGEGRAHVYTPEHQKFATAAFLAARTAAAKDRQLFLNDRKHGRASRLVARPVLAETPAGFPLCRVAATSSTLGNSVPGSSLSVLADLDRWGAVSVVRPVCDRLSVLSAQADVFSPDYEAMRDTTMNFEGFS